MRLWLCDLRIAEKCNPACHQKASGIPDRRFSKKSGMASYSGGITKMGDAAEGLAHVVSRFVIESGDHLDGHY